MRVLYERYDITVENSRKSADIVAHVCGEQKCEPSHTFGPYIREYFLIHYCVSGKGNIVNDGKKYEVNAGELFIICPGQITIYAADEKEPWHYIWAGFDGADANALKNLPCVMKYSSDTFLRMAEYIRQGTANREIYLAHIYEILYHLFSGKETERDVCKQIKDHIRLNYMEELSVEKIAASAGLNRRYLSRIFKEKYGMSIKEYIVSVRCRKAAEFLIKGHTVAESAVMTGYPDQFAFSKMFTKVTGKSPSQYKKAFENKNI